MEGLNLKFKKIFSVGLDTSKIDTMYLPIKGKNLRNSFGYYYTNISDGNESYIRNIFNEDLYKTRIPQRVITQVDFLDKIGYSLTGHMNLLGVYECNVLLVSVNANWEKYYKQLESIYNMEENVVVENFGLANVNSISEIEKCQEYIDKLELKEGYSKPSICFISTEVNITKINKELLEYCYSKNIHVIGLNPLCGRFNSSWAIETFTLPVLLEVASTYSEVVILSSEDYVDSMLNSNYLIHCVNKPANELISSVVGSYEVGNKPSRVTDVNLRLNLEDPIPIKKTENDKLDYYEDLFMSLKFKDPYYVPDPFLQDSLEFSLRPKCFKEIKDPISKIEEEESKESSRLKDNYILKLLKKFEEKERESEEKEKEDPNNKFGINELRVMCFYNPPNFLMDSDYELEKQRIISNVTFVSDFIEKNLTFSRDASNEDNLTIFKYCISEVMYGEDMEKRLKSLENVKPMFNQGGILFQSIQLPGKLKGWFLWQRVVYRAVNINFVFFLDDNRNVTILARVF